MNKQLSDFEQMLLTGEPIKLDLGCGINKKSGFLGIDFLDLPGIDIVANLEEGLPFVPSDSVDFIYTKSFLEHINNFEFLMNECWRVLKPNGRMNIYVPHFSSPFYYSDHTHKRFFGLYSFEYFSKNQKRFRRKVPSFYHDYSFSTEKLDLHFNSPFLIGKAIKVVFGSVINMTSCFQEFYEENLCYLFPCYGINITLMPEK